MAEVVEQFGPYKRIRRLGIGGMAETFLAVQRGAAGFEQRVCMKFILPGYQQNADFRRLFLREASIAASLRHSNIVGVIDVDEEAGYLVLELVDGVDLRTLLNAAPNHRLTPPIATFVTIELCKALSFAHGRVRRGQPDGVVHRDLSPSNVLVSYAGEVKLTDFGVARAMRSDAEPLSTTVKGKLCYMSPEQARGQQLDGRSDLFALGVVFYELLSGVRPFDGNTDAETLLRVTQGQHTPLVDVAPDVPPGLIQIVERLLCGDRDHRFPTADATVDVLAPYAPLATCFRDLGKLARAARPHETLTEEDIRLLLDGPQVVQRPGAHTETVALPGARGGSGRMPPSKLPPMRLPEEIHSETTLPRGVRPNAWYALAAAAVALLVVGIIWMQRISQAADPQLAQATQQPPMPTVARQQSPNESEKLIKVNTTTIPANDGPETTPEPPPPAAAQPITPPTPQVPRVPVATASAHGPDAMLDVGAIPFGQVWIDNKLQRYPVRNVKLRPGKHIVAVGGDQPSIKKSINLKPGSHHKLTINVDTGATDDDTTASGEDR
jgi:eukaryotic-like serine/threonine-protein kinase